MVGRTHNITPHDCPIGDPGALWLIRLSSLGDVIVMSAAVEWLSRRFPKTPLYFITAREFAPIFKNDPRLAGLISVDRRANSRTFGRQIESAVAPRMKERGGYVIDLHNNFRSRHIRARGGLPTLYTLRTHGFRKFLLRAFKINLLEGRAPLAHEICRDLERACARTIAPVETDAVPADRLAPCRPKLIPDHIVLPPAISDRLSGSGPTVAIMPSAKWPAKCWPENYFCELIRMIHQKTSAQCVILGGSQDISLGRRLENAAGAHNFAGALTLDQAMTLLSAHCAALVSNDTGMAHMADALDVPTCVIYGPTTPAYTGYALLAPRAATVSRSLWCRPCTSIGRTACLPHLGRRPCLTRLSPARVYEVAAPLWTTTC